MTRGLALVLLLALLITGQPTRLPVEGKITYYASGLMEQVASTRATWGMRPCPNCVGFIAMAFCADLGRRVWLRAADQLIGPLQVVDCAAPADLERFDGGGYIGEVSWPISRRLHMAGPIHTVISQCSCLLEEYALYCSG